MKKIILLLFPLFMFIVSAQSQIQNVIVEKYYVSDSLDATDSTNFYDDAAYPTPILAKGSVTYRVYVQLDTGFKIKKIYGTPCSPLRFESTTNFYNNIDRQSSNFGYLMNKSWYGSNPTLFLDSWLTLGLATKAHNGVLKPEDTDGSIILTSWGGTSGITGGILRNNDASAGIPIDTADGLSPKTGVFSTWFANGIYETPGTGLDTTIFGPVNVGSKFISTNAFLQQNVGVAGDSVLGNNKVLIAQLTTTGTLTFEINLELLDSLGNTYNILPHNCGVPVSGDTVVNGMLKYPPDPPVCGCLDPNFLEYNASYVCSDSTGCINRIVYGCMDTLACNYDPNANYHIQYLCCYPGNCANRDIALVCPGISGDGGLQLFPNPSDGLITLSFSSGINNETKYSIYDSFGTTVFEKDLGVRSGSISEQIDVSTLYPGLYFVKLTIGSSIENTTFIKQ